LIGGLFFIPALVNFIMLAHNPGEHFGEQLSPQKTAHQKSRKPATDEG